MIQEWQSTFPEVDVLQELRKIRQWNLANPRRRKTRKGILRHVVGWLSQKQDRSGARHGSVESAEEIAQRLRRKIETSKKHDS